MEWVGALSGHVCISDGSTSLPDCPTIPPSPSLTKRPQKQQERTPTIAIFSLDDDDIPFYLVMVLVWPTWRLVECKCL